MTRPRSLAWLSRVLRGRIITNDGGDPYLHRFYLLHVARRFVPGVFVHYFYRSDGDRELHNHPWRWAVSIVLRSGYIEQRMEGSNGTVTERTIRAPAVNLIRGDTFHRVQLLEPDRGCWSIFIAGPRKSAWGFIDLETREFETHTERDQRLAREAT